MLRRTALILTGFLLLALAVTILYALAGFGSPEYTIHKAETALQAENYAEGIRLASVALSDRALDRNRDLRRRALRVRYQAYAKVGDYPHALEDLSELIEKLRDSDVRLVLSRIEITLDRARGKRDVSQALRALERTRMVLAKQPNNPEAMALAGDACRAIYEEELSKLREHLRGSLSPRLLQTVMAKLTDSTFRDQDDPKVAVLERELLTLLPERKNQHNALRNNIRTWVQRGQEYFLRGLRLEPPHVRAYLGIDDILRATGRTDQRLAQAEIYMQRATPKDAVTATAVAARLHLRAGRYRACAVTADRVLAPAVWRRLAQNKSYSPQIQPLLLAKHLALSKLGATDTLGQSLAEVDAMVQEMPMKWHLYGLIQGVGHAGVNDRGARIHLERFLSATKLPTGHWAEHWTEAELLRIAYETRVLVEQRLGTDPAVIANMLAAWSGREPRDPRPLILTAKLCLSAQRWAQAVAAAAHAVRVADNDDDVLRLYAETAVAAVQGTPRDLPSLLARCLRLQKPVPDNIGDLPILVLPLAKYALRAGNLQIATACAQLAADHYPWARWPRYLLIETALEAGRPGDATLDLEVLLRYHPGDRQANELLGQVLADNPGQARALRYASAVYSAPNLNTARFLAQKLYARGEWDRVLALTGAANERFPPDAELMSLAARVLLNRGQHDLAGRLLAAIHQLPKDGDHAWALGQLILWNPTKLSPDFRMALLDGYLEAESDAGQVFALATELRAHGEHVLAHRAATALVRDDRFLKQRTGAWFQLAGRAALQAGDLDEAKDHLIAAAGSGDGKSAALDLTLLHLARGDIDAARESFVQSKRDGVTAACVAARLGDRDGALATIRYRIEADPEHVPTLCILACLDKDAKVPAPIRALADAAGDDLLELSAFLSTDAFFSTALKRTTALARTHPKNPAAVLLGLRAFVRAGQHDGVVPTLFALRLQSPVLMGEAFRILNASNSPELRNSQLMNDLLTYVVSQGASAEPAFLAVVIRHHQERLLASDQSRAAVLKAIFDFWIRYPKLAGVGLDEVDLLTTQGMHKQALQLLEVIEAQLPKTDRSRFLHTFYTIAPKVVAEEPHLAKPFMDRAHKVLTDEGPHGAVLHFLLDTRDKHEPWPKDPGARAARRQQEILFLRAHVERYHGGLERDRDSYRKSLARLFQLEDPDQSLERMEQALRDDPSLLDLWGFRARRLVATNQLDQAIDGLSWIPPYLKDPATEEILLPLELRRDGTLASGEEPGSALARGLLALNAVDFDTAADALVEAQPQVDGSHLFYLALARLGQGGAEGRAAAAECFEALATEYPLSPLSFPALEFAAQLEP